MVVAPRFYLEPAQLERLKQHKYQSQGTSMVEPVMQIFWRWLVTKVPLWVAPNLITFVGLIINVVTTAPIVILDPNAEGLAPSWSYIVCAIGFFMYQSLDAIDGKQARRTDSNTPLGELFDHGCDAVSGVTVLLSALSAVGMHDYPLFTLAFALLILTLNYCYHWQTYVSGVLYFKKFDVTEAQFSHIFLLLVAGLLGPEFFLHKVPYLDIDLKLVVITVSFSLSILNAVIALHIILTQGVGKNGSTVADTSVLSPLMLPLLLVIAVILYTFISPAPLNQYCMLYFLAMILPFVKPIIHLLVASMTKSPIPLFDIILLGPYLALANAYYGAFIPEKYVLIAVAVYNAVDILTMCVSLCQQICESLGIDCFTIPAPSSKKKPAPQ